MIYFAMSFFAAFILVSLVFLAINSPIDEQFPTIPDPGRCLAIVGHPGEGRSWYAQQICKNVEPAWYASARSIKIPTTEKVIVIPSFQPQSRGELEALKTLLTNGNVSVLITIAPADAERLVGHERRISFLELPA